MKRLFSLVLVTIITTCYCFADDTAFTQVDYLLSANYIVEIPSMISLNDAQIIPISASSIDLPDGDELVISIDTTRSAIDGDVLVISDGNSKTMDCRITVMSGNGDDAEPFASVYGTDYVIAIFENDNETPIQFGGIQVTPLREGAKRGYYYGTLYYTIEVRDYM